MRPDATAARGYLLGELSDEGSVAIEQAVLVDRSVQELVEEVEHDLIDDYVDGRLSPTDRAQFERHYLTSGVHRDRVMVARALLHHAREEVPTYASGTWQRWGWVAAVALLALASALAFGRWRSGIPDGTVAPNVAEAPSAPAGSTTSAPANDSARPAEPTAEGLRVAVVLPAIATRDRTTATPRVFVAPGIRFVDLLLQGSANGLVTANAEVRSVDDRVVWTGTSAPPSSAHADVAHAATVSVPSDRVPPDDYILTLTDRSGQVLTRSFFRVSSER